MPLSKPVTGRVFIQADTILGYQFWDHAGVVANRLAQRFQSVGFDQSRSGLTCFAPSDLQDKLLEVRVSPQQIWLGYREGVDHTTVRQESAELIDWIARAINVSRFSRLGLRLSIYWGGESEDEVVAIVRDRVVRSQEAGWSEVGAVGSGELVIHLTSELLGVRAALSAARNVLTEITTRFPGIDAVEAPKPQILPEYSVVLDADLYDNRTTDSIDVKPHIGRSLEFFDRKLLPFVSKLVVGETR